MNERTEKRVKSFKGCKGCKSRMRPVVAGNETCDMFEKREDAKHYPGWKSACRFVKTLDEFHKALASDGGNPPYQLFLRVKDDKSLPEIVARPAGGGSYPADHVKVGGLTVTSLDGWDVAKAICDAVEDGQDAVRRDEIGRAVLDACNMLHDVCALNESLSSKSAVELVTGAKRILEQIAERLQLPLDCE